MTAWGRRGMIEAWIYPPLLPGWLMKPALRPALNDFWPNSAADYWPTACRLPAEPMLAVPHPIIARRIWLWRAETGTVIESLGFAGGPAQPRQDTTG